MLHYGQQLVTSVLNWAFLLEVADGNETEPKHLTLWAERH